MGQLLGMCGPTRPSVHYTPEKPESIEGVTIEIANTKGINYKLKLTKGGAALRIKKKDIMFAATGHSIALSIKPENSFIINETPVNGKLEGKYFNEKFINLQKIVDAPTHLPTGHKSVNYLEPTDADKSLYIDTLKKFLPAFPQLAIKHPQLFKHFPIYYLLKPVTGAPEIKFAQRENQYYCSKAGSSLEFKILNKDTATFLVEKEIEDKLHQVIQDKEGRISTEVYNAETYNEITPNRDAELQDIQNALKWIFEYNVAHHRTLENASITMEIVTRNARRKRDVLSRPLRQKAAKEATQRDSTAPKKRRRRRKPRKSSVPEYRPWHRTIII